MDETSLSRLLNLYPVESLRERWATKKGQTKEDLSEYVAARIPEDEIFEFCRVSHGLTKQHIRILDNGADRLSDLADPLVDIETRLHFNRTRQGVEEFYVFSVNYEAVVGPAPYQDVEFEFLWPVRIVVHSKHAVLIFTIIEKNIGTYLKEDVTTIKVLKSIDEDAISANFLQRQPAPGDFTTCDLNRGVKALWRGGAIDAHYARYKAAASTKTEDMDAKRLMKRDDPDEFQKAMRSPLFKTVFQTLTGDFPILFSADPTKGHLFVNRYPKTHTEVDNVVQAILAAN
jgi:hypothetical protein